MKKIHSTIVWTAVATLFALVVSIHAQQAPAPRDTSPQVLDVQGGKIRIVTVANGLFHPWAIAFVDANTILVTEKNGALRMIRNGVLAPQPVWTSPTPPGKAQRFSSLRRRASEVRRQPVRICVISEAGCERARRSPSRADT